jgi:hypothetical protein
MIWVLKCHVRTLIPPASLSTKSQRLNKFISFSPPIPNPCIWLLISVSQVNTILKQLIKKKENFHKRFYIGDTTRSSHDILSINITIHTDVTLNKAFLVYASMKWIYNIHREICQGNGTSAMKKEEIQFNLSHLRDLN